MWCHLAMDFDLIILGGGFRCLTFLAANPELLERRICIVERSAELGIGAFGEVDLLTNSTGSDLFSEVLLASSSVTPTSENFRAIAQEPGPVKTSSVSAALGELAAALCKSPGVTSLLSADAMFVDVPTRSDPRSNVCVGLRDGRILLSKACVLATGRVEHLNESLRTFNCPVILSSQYLSTRMRAATLEALNRADGGVVTVIGCSHSALSVVELTLQLTSQITDERLNYRRPAICIFRRGLPKLYYSSVDEARRGQQRHREALFNPGYDVFNSTGEVFRFSGLRHRAKELYNRIYASEEPGVEVIATDDGDRYGHTLKSSTFAVQATGYAGNIPEIRVGGKSIHASQSNSRLDLDAEGFLSVGRPNCLASLKVEPGSRKLGGTHLPDHLAHIIAERLLSLGP